MSGLITFEFDGTPIPVHDIDGKHAWLARDVGRALGYSADGGRFVKNIVEKWGEEMVEGVDFDRKLLEPNEGPDPGRLPIILYESGFYLACTLSKKPVGRRLRRWLASEVLPQIARTGSYGDPHAAHRAWADKAMAWVDSIADRIESGDTAAAKALEVVTGVDVLADPFGRWVQSARTARGWSIRELSRRSGVSSSAISNLERGINSPYPLTAAKLRTALGPPALPVPDVVEAEPVFSIRGHVVTTAELCRHMGIHARFAPAVGRTLSPLKPDPTVAERFKVVLESGAEESQWRYDRERAAAWLRANHPSKVASWRGRSGVRGALL